MLYIIENSSPSVKKQFYKITICCLVYVVPLFFACPLLSSCWKEVETPVNSVAQVTLIYYSTFEIIVKSSFWETYESR